MLFKSVLILITIAYPFIVYFGLSQFSPGFIVYFVVALLGLRWLVEKEKNRRSVIFFSALVILAASCFIGSEQGVKMYPVSVNLTMLLLFASSLYGKQSIIEKMARLKEPNLPPEGVRYTRKVTIVWCLFFAMNGSLAFITAFWTSNKVWLFYNGFLAYLLIGTLVVGEWVIRYRVKHRL